VVHGLRPGLVRGHERAAQSRLAVKLFVSREQRHEREFSQKDEHDMAKRRFGGGAAVSGLYRHSLLGRWLTSGEQLVRKARQGDQKHPGRFGSLPGHGNHLLRRRGCPP